MAKYARDVNKQVKIIDVQKQFPGGLKTVDTDDALGRVYLRDVENISLSEFSFLEKRYGLREDEIFLFGTAFPNVDTIQGYFEYTKDNGGVDRILFANGRAYLRKDNESVYTQVDEFISEPDKGYSYPPQSDLEEVFDVTFYQAEEGPMAIPGLITTNDGIGVLEVSAVNRDFESAEIFYKIDSGSFISLGVLTRNQSAAIPGIVAPLGATILEITVKAEDPNENRDPSAEFSQEYREFRNITATFNMDGGTPQIDPVVIGTSGNARIERPTQTITKEGFLFTNWNPSLPREISQNTTFTAEYEIRPFTITYNLNDGTANTFQQFYQFGEQTVAPDDPTRQGFDFDGWFSNQALTIPFTFGEPMPANNLVLYAKWANRTAAPTISAPFIPDGLTSRRAVNFTNNDNLPVTISFQLIEENLFAAEPFGNFTTPSVDPGDTVSSFPTWNGILGGCGSEAAVRIVNVVAQASGKDPSNPISSDLIIVPC